MLPGRKIYDLHVNYVQNKLYNPATNRNDDVKLRSYSGTGTDPKKPYVAPTIEVNPGETVDITLHDDLPSDSSCSPANMKHNVPHCFNGTNLHSHGIWVSPAGNSDNVLISIDPGVSFKYEYNIPPDHPAGTFWYHPHRHGSTALQVSSGMAGALIVRGNRPPTRDAHGDIDVILKKRDGTSFAERILVLQQIQYGCLDKDGNIKVKKEGGKVVAWVCGEGDVGGIESYSDKNGNGFGPGSWAESGRYTSVNGLVLPTFKAKAGDVERWRFIHGGVRDTIAVQFFKASAQHAPLLKGLNAEAVERAIYQDCTGEPLSYEVIASDGLTMAAAQRRNIDTLQPGYRSDALVVFPKPGRYCIVNAEISAPASVSRQAVPRRLLGFVDVSPGTQVKHVDSYIQSQLIAGAQRALPAPIASEVVADLKNGMRLTRFTPHAEIAEADVRGLPIQYLTFFINTHAQPIQFEVGSGPFDKDLKLAPYDPNRIDRQLTVGTAQEWQIQSHFVGHPYHIHVNPFQIVKILDPNGKDVSEPGAIDVGGAAKEPPDPQYRGLKGVWKDTLWIKGPSKPNDKKGIYTIVLRTRYERYIGDFVLHCHILDHEDQGMMQNVRIALPEASTSNAQASNMVRSDMSH
ncbi:L-ascorbate oxidase [Burkholderia sp. ABCPW 14]|nr:L-ascorbate oxidase [Burkholderia sp. ABCPW 14]